MKVFSEIRMNECVLNFEASREVRITIAGIPRKSGVAQNFLSEKLKNFHLTLPLQNYLEQQPATSKLPC